jgi:hypothetical protein
MIGTAVTSFSEFSLRLQNWDQRQLLAAVVDVA